jgi:hypothetical protein
MRKRELEFVIRAVGRVARDREFLLVGSQAVHAYCRRPPAEVLLSQECDLYPKNFPQEGTLLENQLGRGSRFARRHGFYVDVVAPEIANLPQGWRTRLKTVALGNIRVHYLDLYDLVASKLAAGRLKDLEFVGALVQRGIANLRLIRLRIRQFSRRPHRERARLCLRTVLARTQFSSPSAAALKRRKGRRSA